MSPASSPRRAIGALALLAAIALAGCSSSSKATTPTTAPATTMLSGKGAWADLTDYTNQPADVSFVIDNLIKLDTSAGDALVGHLATTEVAVAGHSLGAMTSLGFLNTCCTDKRVKAIVAI